LGAKDQQRASGMHVYTQIDFSVEFKEREMKIFFRRVPTCLGDVSGIAVRIPQIATQERWILVAVDGSGQCRLPLVRFCLIYYELAHCVASKYVFKYVERKSEHFGS